MTTPDTLAHYKLLERLGTGPLGDIYRARDTQLGRTVSIRVLPPSITSDPRTRGRFLDDARAAAALSHPNVAAVYEVGEDQGQLFLAGEFVPGDPLRAVLGGHGMNPRRAIDLSAQLADGVADGHALGLVHGHITPDFIVVNPRGNAKLLDFGLARWVAGTPDEVCTPGDDIKALGAVAAEMVGGKGAGGGELDAIVARARATPGGQGYQSAATLAAELRSLGAILDVRSGDSEPVSVMPPPGARSGYAREILLGLVVVGLAAALARGPIMRWWRGTFGPAPEPVLAVVPLDLETADRSELFFADGLTDDLARRVSRIPGVTVLGRSGLRGDRGRTPEEVGAALGAPVVLTGRVRPQVSPLSLSLTLVNRADGAVLWTATYARDPATIVALQAEAADEIAKALRLEVAPTAARARAEARRVDPAAYRVYLQGRQAAATGDLADAIARFQSAADVDPGLDEALAALALTLDRAAAEGGVADPDRRDAAAARAYQLDPDLPEANAAMALAAPDPADALRFLRHGVEEDRSWGDGYRRIGDRIREADPVDAAAFYRASLAVDPRLEASRAGLALVQDLPEPPDRAEERETIRSVLRGLLPNGGTVPRQ